MDWRDLIVLAHGGLGGLPDHDDLMFLFPTIPAMLVATVVLASVLRKRGLLGDEERTAELSATVAAVAAALSLGAAAIHFAVIKEHLEYDQGYGLFFIGIAWFQAMWSLVYVLRRDAAVAAAGAGVNGIVVAVWVLSRTVGLPFGPAPWIPEEVGLVDLFATGFEVALVAMLVPAMLPRRWPTFATQRIAFERAFVLTVFSILTVTLLASLAFLSAPEVEAAAEALLLP